MYFLACMLYCQDINYFIESYSPSPQPPPASISTTIFFYFFGGLDPIKG